MARTPRLLRAALIVVAAVALDQATKQWALERLDQGRSIAVLPTLEFDLAYNSGFSFSAGSGSGEIVGLIVMGMCGALVWQITRETDPVKSVLLAVILGGALGNLLDRLFRADEGFLSGEVVDFIDVSWYAVFNVADIFVVVGCVAYVVNEMFVQRAERRDEVAAAGALDDGDGPEIEPVTPDRQAQRPEG